MTSEANKLIGSDNDMLRKVGWLLYSREDQDGGLNKDELDELLSVVTVEGMEEIYNNGYLAGLHNSSYSG